MNHSKRRLRTPFFADLADMGPLIRTERLALLDKPRRYREAAIVGGAVALLKIALLDNGLADRDQKAGQDARQQIIVPSFGWILGREPGVPGQAENQVW